MWICALNSNHASCNYRTDEAVNTVICLMVMWSSPLKVLVVWRSLETLQPLICVALTFQAQSPSVYTLVSSTERRRIRATEPFTGEKEQHTFGIIISIKFLLSTMCCFSLFRTNKTRQSSLTSPISLLSFFMEKLGNHHQVSKNSIFWFCWAAFVFC